MADEDTPTLPRIDKVSNEKKESTIKTQNQHIFSHFIIRLPKRLQRKKLWMPQIFSMNQNGKRLL